MNNGQYGYAKNRTYDTKYHTLVESSSYAVSASFLLGTIQSASFALTASYIDPLFISASAAASGFGSGSNNMVNIDTGSFATTGSNTFIGDQIITGSLQIEETQTKFTKTTINSIGTTILSINNTGSFSAALGKYTINNGSNTRAGEFMTAWNGSQIVTTDTSTMDIGNTKNVSFTSSLSAGQIAISVNAQSTGWNIKILTTYI